MQPGHRRQVPAAPRIVQRPGRAGVDAGSPEASGPPAARAGQDTLATRAIQEVSSSSQTACAQRLHCCGQSPQRHRSTWDRQRCSHSSLMRQKRPQSCKTAPGLCSMTLPATVAWHLLAASAQPTCLQRYEQLMQLILQGERSSRSRCPGMVKI